MGEKIEYTEGGKTYQGYLAVPEAGRGPGVIVLHAWWGLNEFFQGLCDRLSSEGFVVFAPDLFHGVTASTVEDAQGLVDKLDEQDAKAAITGAVDYLHRHAALHGKGLGAIGFSLGAAYAILLSTWRPSDFRAVVIFYGTASVDFTHSRAAYQGHFAQVDEWEPIEGVYRLEEDIKLAGRQATFYIYPDAGHWFFEQNRPDHYKPEAARQAWERMLSFLKQQ